MEEGVRSRAQVCGRDAVELMECAGGRICLKLKKVETWPRKCRIRFQKTRNIVRIGCSLPLNSLFLGDSNES